MGINCFGLIAIMKNTFIREVLIFMILMISVFFAGKTLVGRVDASVFQAVFSILESDVEETKSIVWFVNHPIDRQQQIKQCDKDSHLSASRNCVNAEYAEQISRQTNLNTYPVNQHE